jgi:hypothetical protein
MADKTTPLTPSENDADQGAVTSMEKSRRNLIKAAIVSGPVMMSIPGRKASATYVTYTVYEP